MYLGLGRFKQSWQICQFQNERVNSSQTLVWFPLQYRLLSRLYRLLVVETPTVSLRKFIEQRGRTSHSEENQTSVCDELTLSFCYSTKLMNLFGCQFHFYMHCYFRSIL